MHSTKYYRHRFDYIKSGSVIKYKDKFYWVSGFMHHLEGYYRCAIDRHGFHFKLEPENNYGYFSPFLDAKPKDVEVVFNPKGNLK